MTRGGARGGAGGSGSSSRGEGPVDPVIRELKREDIANGFLETLDSLRPASGLAPDRAAAALDRILSNPDHIVIVAELRGRIVAATTLLIEPKFIHGGGLAGHIEDVAVDRAHQRRGLGARVVRHALRRAADRGCYKTVLDCAEDVRPFYEGLGFRRTGDSMRFDHPPA